MGGNDDLQMLRELMETVVDQIDDGVAVSTADGRILYHNRALLRLFGVATGTPLQSLRQFGKLAWSKRLIRAVADVAEADGTTRASDRTLRFEEKVNLGDCVRFLEFSVRRARTPAGDGEFRVVVVRDVSERRELEATLEQTKACGMITANAELLAVIDRARQVAKSDAAVLLQGESGVGKSCFARLIHEHSGRSRFPMVEVNCAAVPEALMESEFFGHTKGAFTGAFESRDGKFAAAHRGTLFLDEIGEIPVHLQAKLLSALEEQRFHRLGSNETIRVDTRIISASNMDLRHAVDTGHFRPELYYRIAVIPLHIPPLRHRIGDIPLLVHHFCDNLAAKGQAADVHIPKDTWQALLSYPWPGNIRELANAVEHGVICADKGDMTLDSLPQDVRVYAREMPPAAEALADDLPKRGGEGTADGEKNDLLAALRKAHGSKAIAAKLLGIDRTTLWRRMQRLGLS
ncbi:MAG: sigma 54-interacting transcriptional regulator [Rhodocyclaceae bacterium]